MPKKLLIGVIVIVILLGALFVWENIRITGEVKISTDKTEYNQEETLQITIKNDLMRNICFSSCYPYYLEKKNGEWKPYLYGECNEDNVIEKCIDSGKTKIFEVILSSVEKGVHRIAVPVCQDCKVGQEFKETERFYSNEFTIKEVDISDWETYRNEEYKYELKYPNQVNYDVVNSELVNFYYELDQASEDIKQYLFKDNLIMYVLVGKNENNLDLEIWVRQKWEAIAKKGDYSFDDFTKSIKPITFNDMKAVEQIDNVGRISINIAKDENVYSVYYDKHRIDKLDLTIDQMLSTFKFIE